MLGAGEQKAALHWIFADRMHKVVLRDSVGDAGPRLTVVGGLEDVRLAIVVLVILHRNVSRAGVMRRRINQTHTSEIRHAGRRDLVPALAAIPGDIDQAIVTAGPDGVL